MALGQLKDAKRPNYIVFLTDGLPTTGETNEIKIVANAKETNKVHARLFSFGVGYDVNSRLLDKLVRENYGHSEYVRPNEDIEDRVSRLYNRIESPVMTGVQLEFVFDESEDRGGPPVNRVYPKDSFDLFAGEQLVLVGPVQEAGHSESGRQGLGGRQTSKRSTSPPNWSRRASDESCAFVEKLWAIRRVGEIIDELDLKGQNEELVKRTGRTGHAARHPHALHLVLRRRATNLYDVGVNSRRAGGRLNALTIRRANRALASG